MGKENERQAGMRNRHTKNLIFLILVAIVMALFNLLAASAANADDQALGKIAGRVINKESAQPLVGATVAVQGTALGAITDLDGNFRIKKLPEGTYTVIATSIGFTQITILEVAVTKDQTTPLNFFMSPEVIETEGIKVEARAEKSSETVLLHRRRNATSVTDGISAQEISRAGSGDAAEAMTKVTGASVVDGKFIFVRGLGDRYANTQLNGSTLPSPDPDKQAVPMDLFPAGLLDNIIVEKSFTPDKPGDFAGGSVNLNTKDYPETRSLVFSTSTGTNSITRYGEDILMQDKGSKDWLGFDDGHRDVPQIIMDHPEVLLGGKNTSFEISENGLADSLYLTKFYEEGSKAFNPEMTGKLREIPLNRSHSLSYGDELAIFNNPLGVVASLTYSRNYSSHKGILNSYERPSGGDVLDPHYTFTDLAGKEEVLWGGLINVRYGIHKNHKLGYNLVYTRNGESESRFLFGEWPEFVEDGAYARNNVLWYTERKLVSHQFSGAHALFDNKIRAEWQFSKSKTKQDEPDIRFFTDQMSFGFEMDSVTGQPLDTSYSIVTSRFSKPQRVWRWTEEDQNEFQANFFIPLSEKARIKHGFLILDKNRDGSEKRFEYIDNNYYSQFNGDVEAYIEDLGLDTITTRQVSGVTRYRYRFTNLLKEIPFPSNLYNGQKEVFATYLMFELPLIWNTVLVGGARYEETEMHTYGTTTNKALGKGISEQDLLLSVNLIYRAGDRMNVRASFAKTVARPSLLEISSINIEGFNDGDIYTGNPNLQMTKIDNYDLRWEWFVGPGEIIAVSGFYKKFKDPIEEVILHPVHFEIQPQNSEDAELYGLELEYRRRLGFISDKLRNFRLGSNFTLVRSEIKLTSKEIDPIREFIDPDFPDTRPLAGQCPYLVNVNLGFDSFGSGTSLSMFYNIFGKRLMYNAQGATPDIYERPRHQLDFTAKQNLIAGASFKMSVKNILNENYELYYDDLGGRIVDEKPSKKYELGRSYSIGVSYQVW